MYKIILSEYGLPSKIVLDAGTNFISENIENFIKQPGIYHAMSSSHTHQSCEQAEAYTTYCSNSIKNLVYGILVIFL